MSQTTPLQFTGKPTLNPAIVSTLKDWYVNALGSMDMSEGIEEINYYKGASDAFAGSLNLLYNNIPAKVVDISKTTKGMSFKKKIIIGTVIYVVIDGRLMKRFNVALDKRFPTENKTKK